jgi:hypothetical protein
MCRISFFDLGLFSIFERSLTGHVTVRKGATNATTQASLSSSMYRFAEAQ